MFVIIDVLTDVMVLFPTDRDPDISEIYRVIFRFRFVESVMVSRQRRWDTQVCVIAAWSAAAQATAEN